MTELTWFRRWAMKHAAAFAMTDAETKAIASWEESMAASYSEAELNFATDELIRSPKLFTGLAGKTLERHLLAIRAAIQDHRAIKVAREATELEDRGTCTLCGGSGRVSVPNLVGIKDGEWLPVKRARGGACYYTYAVLCNCALGRWYGQHINASMLTLEQYELRNPRWRVQMEKRRLEMRRQADVDLQARGETLDVPEILQSLARKWNVEI